ncbi:hypothetical protein SLEP1_g58305 [Rubroshorea leprosula]|uniref:Beta-lactamase-related domain-containing protein n=1 Tax=Rubroshorea leprosula TaxID=152421 RepID=A0AAV5MQF0_9ROSI|nr:hypothetical protein SLEP1_g58305 [Rubroshorea leprosula]
MFSGHKNAAWDGSDEKTHSTFRKNYTQRIQFKGWHNEGVIHMPNGGGGRVILVSNSDPVTQRNKDMLYLQVLEIVLGEG